MQIPAVIKIDESEIQKWISAQLTVKKVEELLLAKGFDAETISSHLKEFKKQLYAKRRSKGFFCAALGAVLGFIGCVMAILNPIPELYTLALFGFTSMAAILICVGMYFLFE
jgi:hypothetical protein